MIDFIANGSRNIQKTGKPAFIRIVDSIVALNDVLLLLYQCVEVLKCVRSNPAVRIDNKNGIIFLRMDPIESMFDRITFPGAIFVLSLQHARTMGGPDGGRTVGAVVGHDNCLKQRMRILLVRDALEEVPEKKLFVMSWNDNGKTGRRYSVRARPLPDQKTRGKKQSGIEDINR